MPLKLRNRWEYKGDDWWKWEAFIDGDTGELNEISYVEYILHPTFLNPIRKIKDKTNGFLMETSGWGTFKLKAFVNKKDKTIVKLEHKIQLEYDPIKGESK
jgi:transcription initiation factor IIF auxiliary subunit